jgi:hypothetical protein
MRARAVLREAWRNTVSGTSRPRTVAVALALVALLLAAADMSAVSQSLAAADEYRSKGASVLILTAEGQVDGRRCDGLAALPGVAAAGALRASSTPLRASVLPTAPLPVSESSPGFAGVLGVSSRAAGLLLGPEAAAALGVHGAGTIAAGATQVPVGATYRYPDDGRRPGLSYAAISPVLPDSPYDECWVDVWPPTDDVIAPLLAARSLSVPDAKPPSFSQLNTTLGDSFNGEERFVQRISRFGGAVAAMTGLALGFVSTRLRRLQFASALHAGVSRRAVAGIVFTETVLAGGLSAAVTLPLLCIASVVIDGTSWEVLPFGLTAAAPAWPGAVAGTLLAVTMTRERHLFRYFKTR